MDEIINRSPDTTMLISKDLRIKNFSIVIMYIEVLYHIVVNNFIKVLLKL